MRIRTATAEAEGLKPALDMEDQLHRLIHALRLTFCAAADVRSV
jgi:hypothetical protein